MRTMIKTKEQLRMNTIKASLLIIITMLSGYTLAQTNSPYSRYGLGSLQSKGSVRTKTMGSAGTAIQTTNDVNNMNPAALVAMDSTTVLFDLGFHANFSNFSNGDVNESVYSGNLDYVTLMIPMHKRWFFSASIQPLSSVGYNINTTKNFIGTSIDNADFNYSTNYKGNGGISLGTLNNSFKLPFGLSLGVELGYLWGNQEETITDSYSLDITSTIQNTTIYHSGFWLTTGAQWAFDIKNSKLIVGATYDAPTKVSSYSESSIYSSFTSIESEKTSITNVNTIPEGYSFGLSFANDKWTFAADYKRKKWSESNLGLNSSYYRDNEIYALGSEYIPNFNSNKYMNRVSYRAGIHYETGSFTLQGTPVSSGSISFGVGLPGRMKSTVISAGIELGTIGGFSNKHISENYAQINIGLNLGEIWFVKPKFY